MEDVCGPNSNVCTGKVIYSFGDFHGEIKPKKEGGEHKVADFEPYLEGEQSHRLNLVGGNHVDLVI